jgi:predicted nuclease of predicted toxin-antitoxin system
LLYRIVADENIDARIIEKLRENSISVRSIREELQGATDVEVLDFATRDKSLIVTLDKDFGELVFSYHRPSVGIVLLRYEPEERESIAEALVSTLVAHPTELNNAFSVLTTKRLRIRFLPQGNRPD